MLETATLPRRICAVPLNRRTTLGQRFPAEVLTDDEVHAHGLRHTHAAQLRAEGVDIAVIRRQLGHASIVTTVRYLDGGGD